MVSQGFLGCIRADVTIIALQDTSVCNDDNMVALCTSSGDLAAQRIEARQEIDLRRLISTAIYGGVFLAPAGHLWYQTLDKFILLKFKASSLRFVVAKVCIDNLVFTPLHVAIFFSWFNFAAEGNTYEALTLKLQKDYWKTVLVELLVWPGWQMITFRMVPLQHQLMTSNLLTLGEATALPLMNAHMHPEAAAC